MRHVGIREFKSQASKLLSSGETLVVERHGKMVGYFVPVKAKDRKARRESVERMDRYMASLLERLGVDEDTFVEEFMRPLPDDSDK